MTSVASEWDINWETKPFASIHINKISINILHEFVIYKWCIWIFWIWGYSVYLLCFRYLAVVVVGIINGVFVIVLNFLVERTLLCAAFKFFISLIITLYILRSDTNNSEWFALRTWCWHEVYNLFEDRLYVKLQLVQQIHCGPTTVTLNYDWQ